MNIDISISKNDIVTEEFNIDFISSEYYDSFEFTIPSRPLSISYDGEYEIQDNIIYFKKDILPGYQEISFTLLYDNLIDSFGRTNNFRTSFVTDQDVSISLTLPEKFILSRAPSATPTPDKITTDGQHIKLYWKNDAAISVFYEGNEVSFAVIILSIIFLSIFASALFFFFRQKTKQAITDILSEDENLVIKELKKGITQQKNIAKNLHFSKSKMSKVIRKLEEKELIEKKPYFKTNKIKLKKI